jgi:hypothetical protein
MFNNSELISILVKSRGSTYGVPGLKCASGEETLDNESIWDEARSTSLSRW